MTAVMVSSSPFTVGQVVAVNWPRKPYDKLHGRILSSAGPKKAPTGYVVQLSHHGWQPIIPLEHLKPIGV